MRILPVSYNTYNRARSKNPNVSGQQKIAINPTAKPDMVSFGSSLPNADGLRSLLSHSIPDLYSKIILLDPAKYDMLFEKQVFNGSLRQISWDVSPLSSSLFKIEYDFFHLLRKEAKINPDKDLQTFVQELVPAHSERLRTIQIPKLKRIEDYSHNFPADLLKQFNHFMYTSYQKLYDEEVFVPFSVKEFHYKLNNVKKRILKNAQSDEEIAAIRRLQNIAGSITDVPEERRMAPGFNLTKYEDQQKAMIKKFADYLERSILAYDKDLIELTDNSEKRIHKEKTHLKFNRKSFIYELQEITSLLPDRRLAHLVEKEAIALPTSKENLSAFIMKAENRSNDQIGFDLLAGSLGTIDHLVASHNGGLDRLSNYALSSAYMNSKKAHKSFAECYRHDPKIAEYAERQIERFIYLYHTQRNIFKDANLDKGYIIGLARTLERLSKDPTLIFDTRRL